jgi:hypothetical protein
MKIWDPIRKGKIGRTKVKERENKWETMVLIRKLRLEQHWAMWALFIDRVCVTNEHCCVRFVLIGGQLFSTFLVTCHHVWHMTSCWHDQHDECRKSWQVVECAWLDWCNLIIIHITIKYKIRTKYNDNLRPNKQRENRKDKGQREREQMRNNGPY